MPAFDIVRRWKGRIVLDCDGHQIGPVLEIYYDAETDQPGWALLELDQSGGKTSFVPLAGASEQAEGIRVPYERGRVWRAPGMPPAGRLWPQDEAALYAYYDFEYTGASLVDLEELQDGEGNGEVDPPGEAVRVGPAARWLLDDEEPS